MTRRAHLLLAVCLTDLCGCSPYIYKDGINKFGSATTAVVSSESAGKAQLAADAAEDQRYLFLSGHVPVMVDPGCVARTPTGGSAHVEPCAIVAANPERAAVPGPRADLYAAEQNLLSASADLAPAEDDFRLIQAYANALVAVTNSADQTQFNADAAALAKAVGSAVAKADASAASGATAAATVLGDAGGYLLETMRFRALKSATARIDAKLPVFAMRMSVALERIKGARVAGLRARLLAESADLASGARDGNYTADFAATDADLTLFNQLNATDPRTTVAALVDAHAALTAALASDQGQAEAFITQVTAFAADAQKLQQALAAASASRGGSGSNAKAGGKSGA